MTGTSLEKNGTDLPDPGDYANQQIYFTTQQTTFMEVKRMNIKNQIPAEILAIYNEPKSERKETIALE